MLQDAHSRKISIKVTAAAGTDTIIAAESNAWIYIHELIGDLSASGTVTVKAGSRELGYFELGDGQGLTLQDEPGEDNRPRFECKPGEAFVLVVTGGTFNGSCHYSLRY
jgi:hypothetical protein